MGKEDEVKLMGMGKALISKSRLKIRLLLLQASGFYLCGKLN
jgi:hypothetical protein